MTSEQAADVVRSMREAAAMLRGCPDDDVAEAQALELEQARAAVQEMIEADKAFDEARSGYNPLYANATEFHRYHDAQDRRAAALLRVQGVEL